MPHHAAPPALFYLVLVPLMLWLRLRRARRAMRDTDFWFEPEGDHFIYHPFGRWGGAFLVSPATRALISQRRARFAAVAGAAFALAAAGPMLLAACDPETAARLRPLILTFRLLMVALILIGGLAWRIFAIRPLYAGAPVAPRRIDHRVARDRLLATRSSASLAISALVVGIFGALALLEGIAARRLPVIGVGALLLLLFALRVRALSFKLALMRRDRLAEKNPKEA